jgi:hypothetical protein
MFVKFVSIDGNKTFNGNIYHDIDGNIILQLSDNYYYLDISKTDDLEWVEMNYQNMIESDTKLKYRSIKLTSDKFSLKGKVLEQIEDEEKELEEDDEYTDNSDNLKTYYKHYPEERDYYVIESDSDSESDAIYSVSKSGETIIIELLDRTLNVLSSYDTFVVDKSTKNVLFALESNQKSAYRVTFNITGKVELNIIGSLIKYYDFLVEEKDNLITIHSKLVDRNNLD